MLVEVCSLDSALEELEELEVALEELVLSSTLLDVAEGVTVVLASVMRH